MLYTCISAFFGFLAPADICQSPCDVFLICEIKELAWALFWWWTCCSGEHRGQKEQQRVYETWIPICAFFFFILVLVEDVTHSECAHTGLSVWCKAGIHDSSYFTVDSRSLNRVPQKYDRNSWPAAVLWPSSAQWYALSWHIISFFPLFVSKSMPSKEMWNFPSFSKRVEG